jgi:hypothetical protein
MNKKQNIEKRGIISCEEIQEQLPAYMLRELGEKQSRLMHEHIRLCENCKREAAQFEKMAGVLQKPKDMPNEPVLSEKHMARLRFSAMHPIFDWIYYQHRMVSAVCTCILLILIMVLLRNCALFKEPDFSGSIPIWRMFRSGDLPRLVEEAARAKKEAEQAKQDENLTPPPLEESP